MPSPKILIADDEAHIRRVLEMKLKGAGYQVEAVPNGTLGLEAAKAFLPDAIVSDYVMPGGMNGVELIKAARQVSQTRDIPAVLLTGSVAVSAKVKSELGDVNNVTLMTKPFSPKKLLKEIVELIGE